jgi:ABC-type amino acid transport system permease subunit
MVAPRREGYVWIMTTAALPTASIRPLTVIAATVLAVFGGFSLWVVATGGYFGFVALAGRDRWGLQILIDLVISLSFAAGWMTADARKRGIASWPYVIATVVLGSLGILAYCVRRGFTPPRGT